jgi:hypothetical protein
MIKAKEPLMYSKYFVRMPFPGFSVLSSFSSVYAKEEVFSFPEHLWKNGIIKSVCSKSIGQANIIITIIIINLIRTPTGSHQALLPIITVSHSTRSKSA